MNITVSILPKSTCALVRATEYGKPGMAIELWLGPEELQELFGQLCHWNNCKALIEGDRVRFFTDGELPAAAPAPAAVCETLVLIEALSNLVRDARDLEGHYTEGFANSVQAAETLLAGLGVEI